MCFDDEWHYSCRASFLVYSDEKLICSLWVGFTYWEFFSPSPRSESCCATGLEVQ